MGELHSPEDLTSFIVSIIYIYKYTRNFQLEYGS